jgi:hypothetical protein
MAGYDDIDYEDMAGVDMNFGHEAFLPPPVKDLFKMPESSK